MKSLHNSSKYYSWKSIYQLVIRHKQGLIQANFIAILMVLVTVPLPLLLPILVDEVLLKSPGSFVKFLDYLLYPTWQNSVGYIVSVTIITIVLRSLGVVFGVWQSKQFTIISKEVSYQIRLELLHKIQGMSMSEYENVGSGVISANLVNDVNTIDSFLGVSVGKIITSVLTLSGVIIVLVWLHWQIALFILLLNPLVVFFTMRMGSIVRDLKKAENKALEVFQQALTETLDSLQQVRASNQHNFFFNKIQNLAYDVKSHSESFSWKSDAASRVSFLIFLLGFDVFRGIAMLMVVFSDLSIGEMMAVLGYLWFMMGPVQEILAIKYSYNSADGSLKRINKLLDLKQETNYKCEVNPFTEGNVRIELQNVNFSYSGNKQVVLKNVNFNIKAGEKLALVGSSGGGKTTMLQLILGFYEPNKGRILYNGVTLDKIGQAVVRENISVVLQQPAMFNDSIRFNLDLGHKLDDKLIWQALEMSQIANYVRTLPDKLDSIIGRNGIKFSGGQRQRLAIARMILQEPKVVIMDEATSALDMETERKLYTNLSPFFAGRTTLIIAHRLSSIKQADRIIVFEDGHIIESGSHEELIKQKGTYQKIYR